MTAQTFARMLEHGRRMGGVKQFLLPQISCVRQSNTFIPSTGMDWLRLMQILEFGERATFPPCYQWRNKKCLTVAQGKFTDPL